MYRFRLISRFPIPWASYQCNSARRIRPLAKRMSARPFSLRQRPRPYCFRRRATSRMALPTAIGSMSVMSLMISKCMGVHCTNCYSKFRANTEQFIERQMRRSIQYYLILRPTSYISSPLRTGPPCSYRGLRDSMRRDHAASHTACHSHRRAKAPDEMARLGSANHAVDTRLVSDGTLLHPLHAPVHLVP
jgi:hypothetical protein